MLFKQAYLVLTIKRSIGTKVWLIKLLFCFGIGFVVFAFSFYLLFLSTRNRNLEHDPEIKCWIGKEFEIKKGVYILKYSNDKSDQYYLELSRRNIDFPVSTEEFLKNPEKWTDFCNQNDWCRPVMPGACFKILKIFKHIEPLSDENIIMKSIILNDNYKNFNVDVSALFNTDCYKSQIFGPKEEIISQLKHSPL